MDAETLRQRLDEVQVVDVRWPNEWEAGRLDGAVHIPSDYLYDHLDELDRDRPIVAVCRSGSRSSTAVDVLRSEGFEADNLEGGLEAWVAAGQPLRAPDGGPGQVVEGEPPPDDRPEHVQALEASFLDAVFAVQEYFGEEEASEEEIREFLRNRLIGEGRTPAEADRILDGEQL